MNVQHVISSLAAVATGTNINGNVQECSTIVENVDNSLNALQKHRASDHQRCPVVANKRRRPEDSTASTSG